jgi:NADPH:quinone reductase-like Zn-dependent oxidoreductase
MSREDIGSSFSAIVASVDAMTRIVSASALVTRVMADSSAGLRPVNAASQVSISDFYRQAWNARIVGFISPVPEETKGEDLAILAGLVAVGRLRPRIGLTLGWEKTAEALAAFSRRGVRGKAVLTI